MAAAAKGGRFGAQNDWNAGYLKSAASSLSDYSKMLASENDYNEKQAVWEAKNAFATHAAGFGGVAGMNAGNLAPGPKPTDTTGLALAGQLGGRAEGAARFSGFDFHGNGGGRLAQAGGIRGYGQARWGASYYQNYWGDGYGGDKGRANALQDSWSALGSEGQWALNQGADFLRATKKSGEALNQQLEEKLK
jgi:hypothetical protein